MQSSSVRPHLCLVALLSVVCPVEEMSVVSSRADLRPCSPRPPARGKIQELRTELQQSGGGGDSSKKDKTWIKKKTVLKKIVANVSLTRPTVPEGEAGQHPDRGDHHPTPPTPSDMSESQ